ncbi:MAG: hypothetical protein K0S09_990 [Sphingobacteriaceae bacterium]|nr:hypothetical protein [Sphingobacteriaceae bacterium]
MRAWLVLSIVFLATGTYGQASNTSYAHLFSDTTLYGSSVTLAKPFLRQKYLMIGSHRIGLDSVKSYQNNKGTFANVGKRFLSGPRFAARVSEGKVNLYQKVDLDAIAVYGYLRPTVRMYFDSESTSIQKANYSTLKPVLTGVPECTQYLNRYRTKEQVQYGLLAGGAVVTGAGMVMLLRELTRAGLNTLFGGIPTKANTGPALTLMCTGSVALAGSYCISLLKHKHIKQAVDAYNK